MKTKKISDAELKLLPIETGELSPVLYEFQPSFIEVDISLSINGKILTLNPVSDITAIELFNVIKWKDMVKCNTHMGAGFIYEKAVEYGISRHFKEE